MNAASAPRSAALPASLSWMPAAARLSAIAPTTGASAARASGRLVAASSMPIPMNRRTAGATSSTPRIADDTSVSTAFDGRAAIAAYTALSASPTTGSTPST